MGNYLIDLFHRASTHQSLTPRERSVLKAVQGAVIGVLIAALPQLLGVLAGKATFSFSTTVVDAIIGAVITAAIKLWSAQGEEEAAIGQVIEAYMQAKLEAQAPGSTAMANNWQAIQFTVPVQPRPIEQTPAKIPVAPPLDTAFKSFARAIDRAPAQMSMPPDAGNARTASSIHSLVTDKTPLVQVPTIPSTPSVPASFTTQNTPQGGDTTSVHIADMATGLIPSVNFTPPTQNH